MQGRLSHVETLKLRPAETQRFTQSPSWGSAMGRTAGGVQCGGRHMALGMNCGSLPPSRWHLCVALGEGSRHRAAPGSCTHTALDRQDLERPGDAGRGPSAWARQESVLASRTPTSSPVHFSPHLLRSNKKFTLEMQIRVFPGYLSLHIKSCPMQRPLLAALGSARAEGLCGPGPGSPCSQAWGGRAVLGSCASSLAPGPPSPLRGLCTVPAGPGPSEFSLLTRQRGAQKQP